MMLTSHWGMVFIYLNSLNCKVNISIYMRCAVHGFRTLTRSWNGTTNGRSVRIISFRISAVERLGASSTSEIIQTVDINRISSTDENQDDRSTPHTDFISSRLCLELVAPSSLAVHDPELSLYTFKTRSSVIIIIIFFILTFIFFLDWS